ncbi:MAG: hypothetical protein GY711_11165 [bacterium]|nr:hypothetical protein [bacterium]
MKKFAALLVPLSLIIDFVAAQGTCVTDPALLQALGSPTVVEDFDGFTSDPSFEAPSVVPTQFGAMTAFGGTGFRNLIDAPPLDFVDNNGTANASCFTNREEPGIVDATYVHVILDPPARAWGADVYAACGFECIELHYFRAGALLDTCALASNASPTFVGYINDECFDTIEIRAQGLIAGPLGQGFGLDDVAVYSCPGPIGMPNAMCTPIANSTGFPGTVSAIGSEVADQALVTILVGDVPAGQFGYLIAARTPANFMPAGSNGFVCVGPGGIGRYNGPGQVQQGPAFQLAVGGQAVPTNPAMPILAGDTWYWQCWHRDTPAGGQQNNLTGAVGITFQ